MFKDFLVFISLRKSSVFGLAVALSMCLVTLLNCKKYILCKYNTYSFPVWVNCWLKWKLAYLHWDVCGCLVYRSYCWIICGNFRNARHSKNYQECSGRYNVGNFVTECLSPGGKIMNVGRRKMIQKRALSDEISIQFAVWGTVFRIGGYSYGYVCC